MKYYTFSDVLFKPKYSEIASRSLVDVSTDMGKFKIDLPIISANMRDITGEKMAIEIAENGGLGMLHRFNTVDEACTEFSRVKSAIAEYCLVTDERGAPAEYRIGVSIGVQEGDKGRFESLYKAGARIFCIDVAHGHHVLVRNMIIGIRCICDAKGWENVYVIAGNIATPEAAKDLMSWGADCVKVGIGPGAVCETRKNTGVGVPQLGALDSIREACPDIKIIADGGIKSNGDIAKALKFANAVMVGSYISGTSETPGHVYEDKDGKFYKTYGGSASAENKVKNGGNNSFVEGVMTTVPFRGHVKHILRKTKGNLQSSFSYSGALNLKEFQEKAEFIFITGAGKSESKI